MIERICHIGVAPCVNGGISSVLQSYEKLYGLSSKNFLFSYNGSFVKSIPLVFKVCAKILFGQDKSVLAYQLHMSYNGSFFRAFLIALCVRLVGKKYIAHIHGSQFQKFCNEANFFTKKMIFAFFLNAGGIIAITEDMKSFFWNFFKKELPVYVIPNPCIGIAESMPERRLNNTVVRIVFSGQYGPRKGVYDLLRAFDKGVFRLPVELHLFGNGEIEKVRQMATTLEKSKSVFVSGWRAHDEYLEKLGEYDFLVLPSYAETFGMSLVEAMGQGLPVVSTFSGGIPNVVDNGKSGILIQAGDIKALTSALETMVDNPELRLKMGAHAWASVSQKYTEKIVLEKLEKMYQEVSE